MKFAKKHRNLFYVPGMISLVLIPVLCLWFIHVNGYQKDQNHMVDIALSDSFITLDYSSGDLAKMIPINPKRKIEYFVFNENEQQNRAN